MEIKIYNDLTNQLEVFTPIVASQLSMYVCGPTVYNHIHIGNARPVVFFDVVHRFFKYLGYQVNYVNNFTDIDDKIIKKALEEGVEAQVIANRYIKAYLEVWQKLNCLPATAHPQVTNYINQIIDYINQLIKQEYAYQVGDNVYFRVRKLKQYGILSNQILDELEVGARIEEEVAKEDPRDFVLWKNTRDQGIKWASPFGQGRPGWHTECCVMINKLLNGKIDIHGGGSDLKFPHHENEIAQTMALYDHYLANYWVHNGRLDLDGEKMSKSVGNLIWTKDLLENVEPSVFRLLLLNSNYRQNINYSSSLLAQFESLWEKIKRTYLQLYRTIELKSAISKLTLLDFNLNPNQLFDDHQINQLEDNLGQFIKEMANDFSTPNAITSLTNLLKVANIAIRANDLATIEKTFESLQIMFYILGLNVEVTKLTTDQKQLVKDWYQAKDNRDYQLADQLRTKILELGIKL